MQLVKRRVQDAVRDLAAVIEVVALVESLIECSPSQVGRMPVEILRITQEIQSDAQ